MDSYIKKLMKARQELNQKLFLMGFSKKSAQKYRDIVKDYLGIDKGTAMSRLKKL